MARQILPRSSTQTAVHTKADTIATFSKTSTVNSQLQIKDRYVCSENEKQLTKILPI
jgi:hypothetical protein